MSIDDRLREIDKMVTLRIMREPMAEDSFIVDMRLRLTDAVIAEIKQAFADEGYVYVPQVEVVTKYERGKKPEVFMVNGKEVMTGQEWCARFRNELEKTDWNRDDEQVFIAAKRAAGIDETRQV